jgi:hypothetical protein
MAERREWLGHRDLCPRQWKQEGCDCPCSDRDCPGIDACKNPECRVAAYLAEAEVGDG